MITVSRRVGVMILPHNSPEDLPSFFCGFPIEQKAATRLASASLRIEKVRGCRHINRIPIQCRALRTKLPNGRGHP